MNQGNRYRKVGSTAMNDTSSRSHSLFTIYIETAETVSISHHHHITLHIITDANHTTVTKKKFLQSYHVKFYFLVIGVKQAAFQGWQAELS